MHTLVLYDSCTGNTQRIAQAIADELNSIVGSTDKSSSSLRQKEQSSPNTPSVAITALSKVDEQQLDDLLLHADLIFVGSWNKRSTFSPLTIAKLSDALLRHPSLASTKHWAYFLTSGAVAGPYQQVCKQKMRESLADINQVQGIFICQGKMGEHVLKKYESGKGHQHDTPEMIRMRIANWHEALHHPNEQDIAQAQSWARKIYETSLTSPVQ